MTSFSSKLLTKKAILTKNGCNYYILILFVKIKLKKYWKLEICVFVLTYTFTIFVLHNITVGVQAKQPIKTENCC